MSQYMKLATTEVRESHLGVIHYTDEQKSLLKQPRIHTHDCERPGYP